MTAHDLVLLALAAAGEATTSDLADATGLGEQARRAVRTLVSEGYAARASERSPARITQAGQEHAAQIQARDPAEKFATAVANSDDEDQADDTAAEADNGARLDDVLNAGEDLPDSSLYSLLILLLSTIAARYHLRDVRRAGWPSAIAAGTTGTGKTLLARIVCRVLGLDEDAVILDARSQTPHSLLGRREQAPGGAWIHRPPAVMAGPFVAIDELDKPDAALRKAELALLAGNTVAAYEGASVSVAAAPYFTLNLPDGVRLADPEATRLLPADARRRAFVLDATGLPKVPSSVARSILDAVPRLYLQHLKPPASELQPRLLQVIEAALDEGLSAQGRRVADVPGLELAALGWAALQRTDDLDAAVEQITACYLTLADTTGTLAYSATPRPGRQDQRQAAAHSGEDFTSRVAAAMAAEGLASELDAAIDTLDLIIDNGRGDLLHEARRLLRGALIVRKRLGKVSTTTALDKAAPIGAFIVQASGGLASQYLAELAEAAARIAAQHAGEAAAIGDAWSAQAMVQEGDRRLKLIQGEVEKDQDEDSAPADLAVEARHALDLERQRQGNPRRQLETAAADGSFMLTTGLARPLPALDPPPVRDDGDRSPGWITRRAQKAGKIG